MSRVKKVPLPKKNEVATYFIASDWHTNAMHEPTFKILLKHARLVPKKQRSLVIGGDFVDCLHLMMDDTTMKKAAKCIYTIEEILIPETESELSWANNILDECQKVFDKIYFVEGNHDWRYRKWLRYCPAAYSHNFDYKKILNFKERNIPFIAYNDYLDLSPNLTITHGSKHGRNHNKQHYEMVYMSVIYGHVHHHNCTSFSVRGIPHKAWSLPCMSDLAPYYQMRRQENNWTNGYATVQVKHNGNFNVHIHETYDDELVLSTGKIIRP